jgi:hypothetical protein
MFACPWLHPAARLLLWLMLAIFLQVAALPLIFVVSLLPLFAGAEIRRHWWRLVLRVRLLLLTLFLVFAYGFPDSAGWLPAWEGCLEAGQPVLRMLVFLGALAWLLVPLRLPDLLGGLWFLLRPLRSLRIPIDRSITRLSLVLVCLENPPAAPSAANDWQRWKRWLEEGIQGEKEPSPEEVQPICLSLPLWQGRDHAMLLLAGALLLLLERFS